MRNETGADEFSKWYDRALKIVSLRPHSQKEVKDFLQRKGINAEVSTHILTELTTQGFLNDQEFVRWFAEQRAAFRPKSKRVIRLELLQKGIARETLDQILGEIWDSKAEIEAARKIAEKKAWLWQKLPLWQRRRKLQIALYQRGFESAVIDQVLAEIEGKSAI